MKHTGWVRIFEYQTLVVALILSAFFLFQGQGPIGERVEQHWWISLIVMCLGIAAIYMKSKGWRWIYGYQGVAVAFILSIYLLFQGEGSVGQRIEQNWWISLIVALFGILQRRPTRYVVYKFIDVMHQATNNKKEKKREGNDENKHQ
ncbi:hypothetical protein [Alicyclobacillus sendaiensis]|uniref:hypothetical protein n=1 Tax=Alicyclobacillus sendaiensis TaxID=192387 RepID=UPI0026F447D5|nr:hypothetical protein [Alicyclobacillus sendaiensis]